MPPRLVLHLRMAAALALAWFPGALNSMAAADAIGDALKAEILGPKTTLVEAQAFCEERVPAMPAVKTAEEWIATADRLRNAAYEKVIFRGRAAEWRDAKTRVDFLQTIDGGPGYRIRKLRFEALPGLWIPALLYEPTELNGRVPLVLNVNGHDSKGKAADYKQIRCINQAKRGMLALNLEWFGMGQLAKPGFEHPRINSIDLCGTSGIATHFLAMKRGLDLLLAHPNADPARVAVTGLSGGGWQTIFISGLDPRVTLSDPVAGYSSFRTRARFFSDLGDSEQTPCDLATVVDYTHLTAMMAPKPTLLTFNATDNCCFAAPHALPPLQAAAGPIFGLFGSPGNIRAHVNFVPGDHNYGVDNRQAFYQMAADFWSTPTRVLSPKEIPSETELKTAEQLQVELPPENLDLHRLARNLAADLPRDGNPPTESDKADAWVAGKRKELIRVVRPLGGPTESKLLAAETHGELTIERRVIRLASSWSIPVVVVASANAKGTTLILNDAGRAASGDAVREVVAAGRRAVAIDPFYFGESKVAERDYLFALLIAAVGERPLGVQVGEVRGVVDSLRRAAGEEAITVLSIGPRSSVVALVTAAIDDRIDDVDLRQPLAGLKDVVDAKTYTDAPELFCFGLLEVIDVKGLAAMQAPRTLRCTNAPQGWESLEAWFRLRGGRFVH